MPMGHLQKQQNKNGEVEGESGECKWAPEEEEVQRGSVAGAALVLPVRCLFLRAVCVYLKC